MTAKILDGKILAQNVRESLLPRIEKLKQSNIVPGLAVILVGEDPASVSYVKGKEKACIELGINSFQKKLPANSTESEIIDTINQFNNDPLVHGILVQLPLPKGVSEQKIISAISPDKDVDGFTAVNIGRLVLGEKCFLPCTPHGVLKLIEQAGIKTSGAHAVIVGRSNIVGKPLANLLLRRSENATVTVCHTGTKDLSYHTKQADILIACAGSPKMIKADMVKKGVCVIDVGVNRVEDDTKRGWHLEGDVDFDNIKEIASSITPVPGGVGPMTITMLLFNTVESAERNI